MSEQDKNNKSAIDLPQNLEVSELGEQELNNISTEINIINQEIKQSIINVTPSELAQIASIDKELAHEYLAEQQRQNTEMFKVINRTLDLAKQEADNDDKDRKRTHNIIIFIVCFFFLIIGILAFFDLFSALVAGVLGISVLPNIISALGNAISNIIRALKYTPRQPSNNKPKPKKRR
nr:hypothetical protein [uncultured Campylobacter sp.]